MSNDPAPEVAAL